MLRFMADPFNLISIPGYNNTKYVKEFNEVNTYSMQNMDSLTSLCALYNLFFFCHWCIESVMLYNLTLNHVLVHAFTTYLITFSSTCFTVKRIIDHEYLLEAVCRIPAF